MCTNVSVKRLYAPILIIAVLSIVILAVYVAYAQTVLRFDKTNYTMLVNNTLNVTLIAENISQAAGISATIRFNPSIIHVADVKSGNFKDLVNGIFTYNINNTAGFIKIAIAGTKPCGVNRATIAYIIIRGVSRGLTLLTIVKRESSWSDVNGTIHLFDKVVNATVKVTWRIPVLKSPRLSFQRGSTLQCRLTSMLL